MEWSEEKNIVWSAEIPGKGWSSPVVAAGKVALTTAADPDDGDGYSLRCLYLNAENGEILWNVEVFKQPGDAPAIHPKNSHASPTPVIAGNRIIVHFGHQGTAALDTTGKILWRNQEHRYKPVHGNGGTPLLLHDVVIFSCDGDDKQMVVGLDVNTGKTRWKTERNASPRRPFSFGTPIAIKVKDQVQVISAGSDVVMSLDPLTGQELWRFKYTGYSQTPLPVAGNGIVYVCTGFDTPRLLAIRTDGKGDVTKTHLVWEATRNMPLTPTPVLEGNTLHVLSDNGILSALDAATGQYRGQQRLNGNFSASPLLANQHLYCLNENGTCYVIRTGEKYEEKAKNTLPGQTLASPAASQRVLFIRTENMLYAIK
jgi:outer membrane protein assembly factor BamB